MSFLTGIIGKQEYIHRPLQIIRRLQYPFLPKNTTASSRLPWGTVLSFNPHQIMGKCLFTLGVDDLALTEAISRLIEPGDTVIDAGANVGYVTSLMATRCSATGHVYAFEPHPDLVNNFLRKNLQAFTNVDLFPVALSDRTGVGSLFIPKDFAQNDGIASLEGANSGTKIEVPLRQLDDMIPAGASIKLMKVDVEGHEVSLFRGAKNLLSSGRVETIIYEEHKSVDSEASQLLLAHGYKLYKLTRKVNGVVLSPPTTDDGNPFQQPVNFLATRNESYVKNRFAKLAWSIYRSK